MIARLMWSIVLAVLLIGLGPIAEAFADGDAWTEQQPAPPSDAPISPAGENPRDSEEDGPVDELGGVTRGFEHRRVPGEHVPRLRELLQRSEEHKDLPLRPPRSRA